jgi:lysophospholipase L1-like esterase
MRILVFGDSITYGAWDKEGGWVGRLRKFLDEKNLPRLSKSGFYCLVYNLGISGNTTEDLLKRFEPEINDRLMKGDEMTLILSIGINDCQFNPSRKDFKISPQKFQDNIKKLLNLARKFSSKIIFVGLTPVDEKITTSWHTDECYKNEYIKKYNEIIKSVCKENKITFVEIFEEWIKSDYKNLLYDGLHPNSKGHLKIFQAVKNMIK